MKKTIILTAILITVACSAIIAVTAVQNTSDYIAPPNYSLESDTYENQGYNISEDISDIEEEEVRKQIENDLCDRKIEIHEQLVEEYANELSEDSGGIMESLLWGESEGALTLEITDEAFDILKKYDKIDSDCTASSLDEVYTAMTAACEILNNDDVLSQITLEEKVMLEIFLEEYYYYTEDDALRISVAETINEPYFEGNYTD